MRARDQSSHGHNWVLAAKTFWLSDLGVMVKSVIKSPDLVNKLMKNMGIAPEVECPHDNLMEITGDAPPLKHSQTEPLITKPHADNSAASDITISAGLPMKTFQLEWKKVLEERANSALINFIVCCGIPPHVLRSDEFKTFVNTLNGNYTPPSWISFVDSLVLMHATAIKLVMIKNLKSCHDLMLTFDGKNLGKKFFSIHTTTVHQQSFCLELDNVTRLSQMGEYIFELAKRCCLITPCLAGEILTRKFNTGF